MFGRGTSFYGGLQSPPLDGCSTASCDFGAFTGEDECMSSHLPNLLILKKSTLALGQEGIL